MSNTILGIDPGTRLVGYCIIKDQKVEKYGVLDIRKNWMMPQKTKAVYDFFKELILQYSVDMIFVERPFMGKNGSTFLLLGSMIGIVHLLGNKCKAVVEVTPCEIKKHVTGKGSAKKGEVAAKVTKMLGITEKLGHDITDAIAIAIYGRDWLNSYRKDEA